VNSGRNSDPNRNVRHNPLVGGYPPGVGVHGGRCLHFGHRNGLRRPDLDRPVVAN